MPLTNLCKNEMIDALCGRKINFNCQQVTLGLSTTTPNADGTGVTEPEGNGYSRVIVGRNNQSDTWKFGAAEDGVTENADIIYMPEATGAWGTLTHFVLFRENVGGTSDVLAFGTLKSNGVPTPVTVSSAGTVVFFRVGDLEIELADE